MFSFLQPKPVLTQQGTTLRAGSGLWVGLRAGGAEGAPAARAAGRGPALLFARLLPPGGLSWTLQGYNFGIVDGGCCLGQDTQVPGGDSPPRHRHQSGTMGKGVRGKATARPPLVSASSSGPGYLGPESGTGPRGAGQAGGPGPVGAEGAGQLRRGQHPALPHWGEQGSWARARSHLGSPRRERVSPAHPPPPRPQCPPCRNHSSEPTGCPARAWHMPGVP